VPPDLAQRAIEMRVEHASQCSDFYRVDEALTL
jgi:hypothetical protein